MRALSDALPTGHRAMANPTLQLHFGCGRATPPVSHSHNWPSGRMQNFLFKIGQKSYFFANKDPKTNFDDWMILQKHVLSFKCNDFFKMANLKAISSSATLSADIPQCFQCYVDPTPISQEYQTLGAWRFLKEITRSVLIDAAIKGRFGGYIWKENMNRTGFDKMRYTLFNVGYNPISNISYNSYFPSCEWYIYRATQKTYYTDPSILTFNVP